jgi:hypothetical protein
MTWTRLLVASVLATASCTDPATTEQVDSGVADDAPLSIDAPPACTTDGRIYAVEQLGPKIEIASYAEPQADRMTVAAATCSTSVTALAILTDGRFYVGLAGGGIAQMTATACTPITITPALASDAALVGVGNQLLALERTSGKLSRIDPMTGSSTMLSTISGTDAKTSLVGGAQGPMVFVAASLGGTGKLTSLDAAGQPAPTRTITGATSSQGQADWVGLVEDGGRLWITASGFFGAGGARRTRWHIITNDQASASPLETYSSTVAVTATTCP